MQRTPIEEPATATMPTTAELILRAAAILQPILPPDFFGKVSFFYERGRPLRLVKEESIKL